MASLGQSQVATAPRRAALATARRAGVAALRALSSVIVVIVLWEVTARAGIFPKVLFPPVEDVARAMVQGVASGAFLMHTLYTLGRLLVGFTIAATIGLPIGLLMARSRLAEDFFAPLLSILLPIPPLALVPLFMLWFGLGDPATIALVVFSACLPMIFNMWIGMKSVNPIWVRAARCMRATELDLFWRVYLPGSLTFVLAGLRIGLARSWRAVVAGEMIATTSYGLGWAIFSAREFLQTEVMLVALVFIGVAGFLVEVFLFQYIEAKTVKRWGMLSEAGGKA